MSTETETEMRDTMRQIRLNVFHQRNKNKVPTVKQKDDNLDQLFDNNL